MIEEAERITVSMVETVADEPVNSASSRGTGSRAWCPGPWHRSRCLPNWKEGDAELAVVETRTVTPIVLFAANGRVFNVRASELPGGKGDGVPVSSLAETQGTAIVGLISAGPETPILLASTGGYALRAKIASFVTDRRAGKQFVSVGEGESLLRPSIIPAEAKEVAALSSDKRLLVFPIEEVNELPNGGRGVMAMKLHAGEPMVGLKPVTEALSIATVRGDKRGTFVVKPNDLQHYRGSRARTGRALSGSFKKVEGFES